MTGIFVNLVDWPVNKRSPVLKELILKMRWGFCVIFGQNIKNLRLWHANIYVEWRVKVNAVLYWKKWKTAGRLHLQVVQKLAFAAVVFFGFFQKAWALPLLCFFENSENFKKWNGIPDPWRFSLLLKSVFEKRSRSGEIFPDFFTFCSGSRGVYYFFLFFKKN